MKSTRAIVIIAVFAALLMCVPAVCSSDSDADANAVDCSKYYYNQLDDLGKQIYDKVQAMTPGNTTFSVDTTYTGTFQDFSTEFEQTTLKAVQGTLHMEGIWLYWIENSIKCSMEPKEPGKVTITLTFTENHYYGDDIATDDKAINDVIKSTESVIDTSNRLSTVRSIHSYVLSAMEYYKGTPIPDTTDIRSLYTALVGNYPTHDNHQVVCEGYAKAFKAICDYYNVPCIIVTGDAGTYDEYKHVAREGHMWNEVQMDDGKWYMVDCTWDDQSVPVETYLLKGNKSVGFDDTPVGVSHLIDDETSTHFTYPTLEDAAYEDDIKEGQCGTSDVYWRYSVSDCSLTFTGKGAFDVVPTAYATYLTSIKTVTFEDGVTGIPAGILTGMTALEKVSFADSVKNVELPIGAVLKDVHGNVMTTYDNVHGESFTGSAGVFTMVAREYDAVFVADGKTVGTVKYTLLQDRITPPSVPAKTGYTGAWEDYTLEQYGITVNAVYTKEKYTVTFDGVSFKDVKVYEYDDVIVAPAKIPAKDPSGDYTYEFADWKGFTTGMKATSDVTFTAEFITIKGGSEVLFESSTTSAAVNGSMVSAAKTQVIANPSMVMVVKLTNGTVTLDAKAVNALGSGDLVFSIVKVEDSQKTSEQKKLVGDNILYSVTVTGGLKSTDGKVTVTVPYTKSVDTSVYKACCIDDNKISDKFDITVKDGFVTFSTPHLSLFAIMDPNYKAPVDNDYPIPGVPLTTMQLAIIAAIIVLLVIALVAVHVHRAHKA